jgi:hypothetical protein
MEETGLGLRQEFSSEAEAIVAEQSLSELKTRNYKAAIRGDW